MIIEHKDYTNAQRTNLADKGEAMPHGGFPIRNRADLKRAIQAFGRAKDPAKTKSWIMKRAKDLDAEDLIPDIWKQAAAHSSSVELDIFLSHYGVLGMRWGVRNEKDGKPRGLLDPTAKVAKEKAKREEKAAKFTAKSDLLKKKISEIETKQQTAKGHRKVKLNKDKAELMKERRRAIEDAAAANDGKLTTAQRRMLIGGAVVGGLLLAGGAYYLVQSGEMNRSMLRGVAFIKGESTVATDLLHKNQALAAKDLNPNQIFDKVVKDINPDYGRIGSKVNCRRCTFAYEMRRRGFDVAATRTTTGYGQNAAGLLNAVSPGREAINTDNMSVMKRTIAESGNTANTRVHQFMTHPFGINPIKAGEGETGSAALFKRLAKHPNGARGEVGIQWSAGGGHSVAYEVINGKPHIFDTQSGKSFASAAEFAKGYGGDDSNFAELAFTRLDNVDLNEEYLLRWVKNA